MTRNRQWFFGGRNYITAWTLKDALAAHEKVSASYQNWWTV